MDFLMGCGLSSCVGHCYDDTVWLYPDPDPRIVPLKDCYK
mgnify:CR=1 FL=1